MTLDYILTVFITMVTVVDPIGLVPVYIPIANRFAPDKQKMIVFKSFLIAVVVSSCFLLIGKYLFKYLGIDLDAIYIVGGILIFMIGLDMIYARPRKTRTTPKEQEDALATLDEVSVFPLAIPMLAGPGTIATLIMFASKDSSIHNYIIVFSAMCLAFLLAAFAMFFSNRILTIFGKIGINVLDRVMGIILCSLAVQFIINAVVSIIKSL
ncbi:MAG: MarC family protein [Bacteriovoracaceae bacterium]|nr:MarC family protein [Bacteriovoracaceae bacterium]